MTALKVLSRPALLLAALATMGGLARTGVSEAQVMTTTITTGITTACVVSIVKVGFPDLTSPTSYVYIDKFLDMTRSCSFVTSNNAALCNPGVTLPTNRLIASVTGPNINMNPSCSWSCTGCGAIVTNAADDGLPVELMDFGVDDADAAASGAGNADRHDW